MAIYNLGSVNPNYPSSDTPPTAYADTTQVAAQQLVIIDALSNDTDPNVADQGYLGVGEYSDPMIGDQVVGTLKVIGNKFYYTANDSSLDTGAHTVTFSYTAVDQWGAESNWATVTVNVSGNSAPGQTLVGLNPPNALTGGPGNDYILGGNNRDTLSGNAGADTLIAGNGGGDSLNGGAGDDLLNAGNGKDTLNGGTGNDTLTGGHGPDLFIFENNPGKDIVKDFDFHNDTMKINPFVFGGYADVLAHAHQVGSSVVIATSDGQSSITLQDFKLASLHSYEFTFG
jgi:Ca2+-binding RTX toxin-like protein